MSKLFCGPAPFIDDLPYEEGEGVEAEMLFIAQNVQRAAGKREIVQPLVVYNPDKWDQHRGQRERIYAGSINSTGMYETQAAADAAAQYFEAENVEKQRQAVCAMMDLGQASESYGALAAASTLMTLSPAVAAPVAAAPVVAAPVAAAPARRAPVAAAPARIRPANPLGGVRKPSNTSRQKLLLSFRRMLNHTKARN